MLSFASTLANVPDLRAMATSLNTQTITEGPVIRQAAAELFRQGRVAEAEQLTREALVQYPNSEDILVIRALICEVQHDWTTAAAVLERLVRLQGKSAPVDSWLHWLRVLRCDGRTQDAADVATEALLHFPDQPGLAAELQELVGPCLCSIDRPPEDIARRRFA